MTIDVQSAVLVYLRDNPHGATIKEIAEAIGCSPTAVRNNLRVAESRSFGGAQPWVKASKVRGTKGLCYFLTPDGERVAGYRVAAAKRNA